MGLIQSLQATVSALQTGRNNYGKRYDGTNKGSGYLGEIKLKNGSIATEYSVGINIDGKEVQIPTIVPTLSNDELSLMVNDIIPNGKAVPRSILNKAVEHASKRIGMGQSPFFN